MVEVFDVMGFSVGHGVAIQCPRLTSGPGRGIIETLSDKEKGVLGVY